MSTNLAGLKAKLYYRSTGSYGSPTHTEVSLVKDFVMNQKPDSAEVITRATRAKKKVMTTIDIGGSGSLLSKVDDPIYLAIYAAMKTGAPFDIMMLTGLKTNNGEVGWRYEALVEDMTQDQGSGNALYDTFAISPNAESAEVIQSVAVASGAPVFTTYTGF